MNLSALRAYRLVAVIFATSYVLADQNETASEARPSSLQDALQDKPWATVATDQAGYRLRLLTVQEKQAAEKIVDRFIESRDQGSSDQALSDAYRKMPSDVREGRFYRMRRLESSTLELTRGELHVILPLTSVRVVLIGPSGSFSSGGPFDSRSTTRSSNAPLGRDFTQALRGGGRGGMVGRSGDFAVTSGSAAGVLGAIVEGTDPSDDAPPTRPLNVFFLQHAEADSLVEIIADLFADLEIRIAIDTRLNAMIVQGDPSAIEQIENLVKTLDIPTPGEPQEAAEAPTLNLYQIRDADPSTVMRVLQTLLAGQPEVRISVDPQTNHIIVLARAQQHATIKATLEKLEAPE